MDSKNAGPHFIVSMASWRSFIAGIKAGEFTTIDAMPAGKPGAQGLAGAPVTSDRP